ncbi:NfeD-like protein [Rivularia sp. PCC 7116]|uniref:NfeD family protein n=1 Tax=Rivularia sp. PCC 7116 TaxID=373994 RepID=UPI00029F2735|nr:NfeD family protein [Rivularia sp. PCC 7116]AFY58930.1 NfeD-like protein [Rivularia sp. PCC 7116]
MINLFVVALIAIAIGICCGAVIVFLIVIQRRRQKVDSMRSTNNLVGLYGTVEIPFDKNCKGKIRVNMPGQNSTVDFVACTDDSKTLQPGDRVFIVQVRKNQLWVISENSLNNSES